jgi:hypothetical protein
VAVWRITDGAKPYRFTRIGKDRGAKTDCDAILEKLCAHGQSSQIGMLSIHFGTRPTSSNKSKRQLIRPQSRATRLTAAQKPPNNLGMAKPETVRRIKSYSAESGYVYQYQFQDAHPSQQGSAKGNEYVYYVSADRKKMFPVRIFVGQDAIKKWDEATGRPLTGTEEYAAAKMRLFQAFDEGDALSATGPALVVDESNLNALLQRLDL